MIHLVRVFFFLVILSIFAIHATRGSSSTETTIVNGFNYDSLLANDFHEPGPESEDVQSYFDADANSDGALEGQLNPVEFKPHLDRLVETSDFFGLNEEGHKKYKVLMLFKEKGISYIFKVIVFPSEKGGEVKVYDVYIDPLKLKCKGKYYKIVVVPRSRPEAWKEIKLCIPHIH
ncbi:1416_t:CDS:1 [Acaulospora morrowiae]|uniref:1416_t:CDS:1 n=1 Tax=Acaulospora morrowiae TaxID=94023 RepID=A0A9N9HLF7_9GLOM|nr:1416_t:CDS:1 [Acaulospora morrowiae]